MATEPVADPLEPPLRQPLVVAHRLFDALRADNLAPNARIEPLAIVFPNNSSYFPPGADDRLRGLLAGLAQGGAYEIALQSSVSGSRKVVGAESVEEAMRYNQWLAERRLERVRDWLGRHAAGRTLTFREDYRASDDRARSWSRRGRPADPRQRQRAVGLTSVHGGPLADRVRPQRAVGAGIRRGRPTD